MNLPIFKQSNLRWANKRLGQSNYTMASAGCLVTCLSMVASYFRGKITPLDVLNRLIRNNLLNKNGVMISYQKVASVLGLDYFGYFNPVSTATLINFVSYKRLPVIAQVGRGAKIHFVVLTYYDRKNKFFLINDPLYGEYNVKFNKRYRNVYAAVVYEAKPVAKPPVKPPVKLPVNPPVVPLPAVPPQKVEEPIPIPNSPELITDIPKEEVVVGTSFKEQGEIMSILNGKKSYIVAAVVAVVAVLNYLGYLTPEVYQSVLGLLGAAGIYAVRNAIEGK